MLLYQVLCCCGFSLLIIFIVCIFGVLVIELSGKVVCSRLLVCNCFGSCVVMVLIRWCMVGKGFIMNSFGIFIEFVMVIWLILLCIKLIIIRFLVWFFVEFVSFIVCLLFFWGLGRCGSVFLIGWVWILLLL